MPRGTVIALRRWAVWLVAVGIAARVLRWSLGTPLWTDEAFVALNLLDRDYSGLATRLDDYQVAPVPFLWAEKAAAEWLGYSERVLRLVPLLAGSLALVLFGLLARRTVPAAAAVVAVGLLAGSRWPTSLALQVKPYSLDLLAAVALLLPAALWLRRPQRLRHLAAVAVVGPAAMACSFPAVFVAGGVAVSLAPAVWRHPNAVSRWLYAAYVTGMFAAFGVCDVWLAAEQLGPPGSRLHDFMADYWGHGFPPADPADLPRWLAVVHTGLLFAYPVGNADGAGVVAFPLAAVGAVVLARRGRWGLFALLVVPFGLNLVASALHKYPYGGCCRLSQHLAPAVCLLVGVGADALARRTGSRARVAALWGGGLAALAAAGVLLSIAKPYREVEDLWCRTVIRDARSSAGPGGRVELRAVSPKIRPLAEWYLRSESAVPHDTGTVWVVTMWSEAFPPPVDTVGDGKGWERTLPVDHGDVLHARVIKVGPPRRP